MGWRYTGLGRPPCCSTVLDLLQSLPQPSPEDFTRWQTERAELINQQQAAGLELPAAPDSWQRIAGRRIARPLSNPLWLVGPCPDCGHQFVAVVLKEMNRYQQRNRARTEAKGLEWNHPFHRRSERCDCCQLVRARQFKAASARKTRAMANAQRQATCKHCSASFTPKRSTAQFCSTACRVAAHRASR